MKNILSAIYHTLLSGIAVAIPVIIMQGYSWESLTVGGVLAVAANWAKLQLAK